MVYTGVTIGFEQTVYNVTEGVDASVEICAVLTTGTLEREAVVTFSTSDGTATSIGMSMSLPDDLYSKSGLATSATMEPL